MIGTKLGHEITAHLVLLTNVAARKRSRNKALRKEIRRLEDLPDIEAPGRGQGGESNAGGLQYFLKKVPHDRLGVHSDEFLSKDAVEQIDIARMDAERVVDHR